MSADHALEILYEAVTASPAGTPAVASDSGAPAPHESFAQLCVRLGLPRKKLNRYIQKELGCSGEQWVNAIYSASK